MLADRLIKIVSIMLAINAVVVYFTVDYMGIIVPFRAASTAG